METKRFVGSFVNVILTRQTCGQRSSRAAESKRRAIGNYFSERICYMFLISKCRGDSDLGLCTTSVLAFGDPQRNAKSVFNTSKHVFFLSDFTIHNCVTFTKLLKNRFVSTTKNSMKYVVNWIPLRIRVRSRNTQPHLNAGRRTNF